MKKKVLVVEYEPRYVKRIQGALEKIQWPYRLMKDVQKALEEAKTFQPDIVLAAALLPKMKSQDFIKALRSLQGLERAQFILMMTGITDSALEEEARRKGVSKILPKPFSEQRLIDLLESLQERETVAIPQKEEEEQGKAFTSKDLFGDILSAEAKEESAKEPSPPPPSAPRKPKVRPTGDIDELLEKTLTDISVPKKTTRRVTVEEDIEKRLTETLAGISVPSKPKPAVKKKVPSPPKEVPVEEKKEAVEVKKEVKEAVKEEVQEEAVPQAVEEVEKPPKEIPKPKEEGEYFGQYLLLEKIATGGMAEVYKAKMHGVEGFEKLVAIKRILPHLSHNEEFTSMFIDEAKLAARLNHKNIIHIYDLGKIDDSYFIAMEYVDGIDLRALLRKLRKEGIEMPIPIALFIASQLASALSYAHKQKDAQGKDLGLVHRDVSPQNILISREGNVKLCDFGIAKAHTKATHTRAGALKGKLQYMSPEQAWGKAIDKRSDLFSLGTVLYECIAGTPLFQGDSELDVLEKVRQAYLPSDLKGNLPDEVWQIIEKALQKEVSQRFENADAMLQSLEGCLQRYRPLPNEQHLSLAVRWFYEGGKLSWPSFRYQRPSVEKPSKEVAEKPTEKVIPPTPPPPEEKEKEVPPTPLLEQMQRKKKPPTLWVVGSLVAVLVIVGGLLFFKGGAEEKGGLREEPQKASQEVLPPEVTSPPEEKPSEGEGEKATLQEKEREKKPQEKTTPSKPSKKRETQKATPPPPPRPALEEKPKIEEKPEPTEKETVPPSPSPEKEVTPPPEPVEEVKEEKPPEETPPPPKPQTQPKPTPKPETKPPTKPSTPIEAPPKYKPGDIVPIGTEGLIPPKLLKRPIPRYPPIAKRQRIQGMVMIQVLVNEEGKVEKAKALNTLPLITDAALQAAKKARFKPATYKGFKVKCWFTLRYDFKP